MNTFGKFLSRNSAETCLKRDYFDSKSPKIAKKRQALGADPPDPFASGSWASPPHPHSG